MVRRASVVAIVLGLTLPFAGAARADADPASDVLYVRDVFLPLSTQVSPESAQTLYRETRSARRAGKPIKVAVIASPNDLGGVPSLFGNPTYYARFLGAELQFLYTGRLLVVMPQGAGLSRAGRLVADPAVVHARIESGADGLVRTAIRLVGQLEGGTAAATSSASHGGSSPVWLWILVSAGSAGALLSGGVIAARRRMTRRQADGARPDDEPG